MKLSLFLMVSLLVAAKAEAATATETLHALFKNDWEYTLEQSPTWASQLGDRRWNDRWEDVSIEAIETRIEHARKTLVELRKIDRAQLSAADQLNFDLFERRYESGIAEAGFRWYLVALNQRDGIQFANELADALRFETEKDFQDWIARLRSFGGYMDQNIELLRAGMRARIVQPKATMQRVPAQIRKQLVVKPDESPFFQPLQKIPAAIPEMQRDVLQREGREAINSIVVPAYARFLTFFEGEYLPACFDEVGVWQTPRGGELYAFLAQKFTTTKLAPPEIHALGLREVSRIRGEMQRVMERSGFKGTLGEFFTFLRNDPQFYFKSGEELLAAYRAMSREIDPLLVRLFRTLPRMPYGIEPVPAASAPDTTTAYYRGPAADGSRAGTFFANLYKPETRPKWEMMALSLHEAVPGHHLQIALAMEQGQLPEFRRHLEATAYVEGWALYCEALGDELGLYKDPYAKMGQLTYEMWRAVRLVVDTGLHDMKWTRQQAIDFFKEHAPKTEQDIVNEVDRYISWPGQALAYKIGELKIKELRARSQRQLGDKFDVREFHDLVLLTGALPLDVLEKRVDQWLHGKRARAEGGAAQ